MQESIIEKAGQIRSVRGAALLKASGKVAASSIEGDELNQFFELLYGALSELGPASGVARAEGVLLQTDKQEVLSLFMKGDEALAIVSEKSRPLVDFRAEVGELVSQG